METNRYTKGLPAEPGIYWTTNGAGEETIVDVGCTGYLADTPILKARRYGMLGYYWDITDFGPYWAGPICKPEAPEV